MLKLIKPLDHIGVHKLKKAAEAEFEHLSRSAKTHSRRNFAEMRAQGIFIPEPLALYDDVAVTFDDGHTERFCSGLRYEYIENTCLRDFISAAKMNEFEICHRICLTVGYMNREGFYHMDLAEKNLLFGKDGHVFVVDFTGAFIVENGTVNMRDSAKMFNGIANEKLIMCKSTYTALDCEEMQARSVVAILNDMLGKKAFSEGELLEIYGVTEKGSSPLERLKKHLLRRCSPSYKLTHSLRFFK